MKRNEHKLPAVVEMAGIAEMRNPGVTLLWVTKRYTVFKAPPEGVLFNLGEPETLEWYAEGRAATRAEVLHSIDTGLPALEALAAQDGAGALRQLAKQREQALKLVPA